MKFRFSLCRVMGGVDQSLWAGDWPASQLLPRHCRADAVAEVEPSVSLAPIMARGLSIFLSST